ncbi:MAG: ADP-ribosylglycohydrolase family protein [Verrucomicrobia bacterium]|nr:ADP-ribosylglycohydrolase family protein [Verrucomicrobiota bacterium]
MMNMLARYRGALLGLAAGDALGAAVEFMAPGSFEPLTDLRAGGPHGLQRGQWTDDTSMALCLAESLVECPGFNPVDQMERYVRWWREGYLSSTGTCFDIGNTTRAALARFEQTRAPYCGSAAPHTAGNGSLMRLAPVALFYRAAPGNAVERAADSSRTTHAAAEAVDSCRYFCQLLIGALNGLPKHDLFAPTRLLLVPKVAAVAAGSFLQKEPPAIRGSGYVVESLEAALWAFARSENFRDGALLAANLGDDADTTAAVYGQLAGAHYGADAIPASWRRDLALSERILSLADRLLAAGNRD